MAKFHDITMLLGQLDGADVRKQLDGKLRGENVNKLNDDGKKLLPYAAWHGYVAGVKYLVEKGADVNLAASDYGFTNATPLLQAVATGVGTTKTKLETVKFLIGAGADVNTKLLIQKGLRPFLNGFKGGTLLDYVVTDAVHEKKVSADNSYDAGSRRDSKTAHQQYTQTIPLLLAAGATGSPATTKAIAKLGVKSTEKPLDAKWVTKVRAKLKKGTRDAAYDACEAYLSKPDAVANAEWPKLVEEIIAFSKTFEDVAEEVYGERVSFEDDEGWLCQGWENHVFLDIILELLGKQETLANKQWERLVKRVLELRRKYHATDYVPVDEFFANAWVRKHPAYKQLVAVEKKTR